MEAPYVRIPYPANGRQAYRFLPRKNKGAGGGGMGSNHRLVHFTHALCQLSYPATRPAAPFRNLAQRSIRYVLRKLPSSKKNITKRW